MEVARKIVSADMLTPIIDLPWVANGEQVEVIVFPVNRNQVSPYSVEKKTSDVDLSFGGWADMDKTTEEICSEIRASRIFRNRDIDFLL